ncbi:MAG TPA: type II toxin-antitoxin system RelE/ParE family toxin [Thermoanaerobaculia bacterium]|nr:type II toxin-antitoxin system RelE/ParE family toxin [Thermoanaerobaculia bacterium]
MNAPKRATVYFDADLHRALRLKAAAADRSISAIVNEAVRLSISEDAGDLAAFEEREHEPAVAGHRDRHSVRQGPHRVVYSVDDDAREVIVVKVGPPRGLPLSAAASPETWSGLART